MLQFGELGALFGGMIPQKPPHGDRTESTATWQHGEIRASVLLGILGHSAFLF